MSERKSKLLTDEEIFALGMSIYEHLSAADLHRERARLLRIVVMQRYMEMRVIMANADVEGSSVAAIMAKADSRLYECALRRDAALEELAAKKEQG